MPRQKETPAIPTVHEALDVLTIEQLQPLVALLPTPARPTHKGELVRLIEQHPFGAQLRALWGTLMKRNTRRVGNIPTSTGLQRPPSGPRWHLASLRHEEGCVGVRRNAVVTAVISVPGVALR